jgi:hypothetical protein
VTVTTVHGSLALVTSATLVVMAVLAAASSVTGRPSRLVLDRVLLLAFGAVALSAISGLALAIGGPPLGDPLHLLYGVAVAVALVLGRSMAGREGRSRWWLTTGAILAFLLAVRASLTGG